MSPKKSPEVRWKFSLSLILFLFLTLCIGGYLIYDYIAVKFPSPASAPKISTFKSEAEFKEYLTQAKDTASTGGYGSISAPMARDLADENTSGAKDGTTVDKPTTTDRTSTTNVQVEGIDEPDIVKTDGNSIFFSTAQYYKYGGPIMIDDRAETSDIAPLPQATTKVLDAIPAEALKQISTIDKSGNLLLIEDTLIVFQYSDIYAYDVSDPVKPTQSWHISLKSNTSQVDARLLDDKLYLITQTSINTNKPCPVVPLQAGNTDFTVRCVDIYHPSVVTPTSSTFTVSKINILSGKIEDSVTFAGSTAQTIVYMSQDNIYLTYRYTTEFSRLMLAFLKETAEVFPDSVISRIEQINSYDISEQSKITEIGTAIETYLATLDDDARRQLENDLQDKATDYFTKHIREIDKTGIIKIANSTLDIKESGFVPGSLLNQFALDEYKGNLRVATTVGENIWGSGSSAKSLNDVYVLGSNLKETGSVKDMGKGERIYSVRFIGDKGYVVTFRQIDPFYVLDLSDASNPAKVGELKISGYSAYLHPISDTLILGVGRESSKVKLSLFDVSDPKAPKELDKYNMDDYWTDIENNHHAFLMDAKHKVFFIPGSNTGYIFSYENDNLTLKVTKADIQAKRAIYIGDNLYILGSNKVVVLDEKSWETVKELEF